MLREIHNFFLVKNSYEKIVIVFLTIIGLLYLLFVPPSQVPDAVSHLYRSYEISEGVFIGKRNSKSSVPRDLEEKLKPTFEEYKQIRNNINSKTDYKDKVEVENSAASYPFILYIFSATGFFLARILGFNIIVGCYLAKIFNYIVFLIAAYYTLKILPFGKYVYTVIMFTPMFLHQATSVSADSILNTLIMFFIAFLLNLYFKKENITKKESIILVILSCLISIAKYVYIPIVFMSAIMIHSKNLNKRQKIITLVTIFILSIILSIGLYFYSLTYETPYNYYFEENNINTREQVYEIIHNPWIYLKALKNTFLHSSTVYINEMIGGSLGWLYIEIPNLLIDIFFIIMLASCFIEKNKHSLNRKQKMLGIIISIGIVLLIVTGMYLAWTGVGEDEIEGVQGRYFIPILFLLLLCVCKKDNYIKLKNVEYKLPLTLSVLNLPVLYIIYSFFNK